MLLVQFLSFLPDPNERDRKGKKQGGKYTLILEITKAKCAHYRKDYKDMADYIHCLISSGNVSKKEAKLEYQNALLWHA